MLPDLPAGEPARLTWDQAQAFATWAGGRLPTVLELRAALEQGAAARVEAEDPERPIDGEWVSTPFILSLDSALALVYDRVSLQPPTAWCRPRARAGDSGSGSYEEMRRAFPYAFRLARSRELE